MRAARKLRRPGTKGISGFSCRLRRGGVQPIVCQRRARRILAPV